MLPDECDEVERSLLRRIIAAPWPWTEAMGLLGSEGEVSGLVEAGAALARLEVRGYVERWSLPAVASQPGRQGRAESLQVVLTPFGMARCHHEVVMPEGKGSPSRLELGIVENETNSREWYGWPGQMPRSYRLPVGDRMPSLSDPRMARFVDSLTTTGEDGDARDDAIEFLADRESGEVVTLFGVPVAVASTWGKAEAAVRAKRDADEKAAKAAERRAG